MEPFAHVDDVSIYDGDSIGQEDQYNFQEAVLWSNVVG